MLGKSNEEALKLLNAQEYQNTPCRMLIMHGPRERSVAGDDVDPSLDEKFPNNLGFRYYLPAAFFVGVCSLVVGLLVRGAMKK